MNVTVDIRDCLSEGLSPSQYCYLRLLWEKKLELAKDLYYNDSGLRSSMEEMIKTGYILYYSEETGYSVDKKKCDDLFNFTPSDFWEVFTTYPIKVNDGAGGVRVLRARSHESKDAKTAFKKYQAVIKTKVAHKKVLKCLELELENRIKSNSLSYMQNLITWINQRTWEKYEALLEEEKPKEDKHGERLV
jgi:hypothetical protein